MSKNTTSYHFKRLVDISQSFCCNGCLQFRYNAVQDEACLYFIIKKNYGSAPERALLKRRIRYLHKRACQKYYNQHIGLIVKPLKRHIKYEELKVCFDLLNKKLA